MGGRGSGASGGAHDDVVQMDGPTGAVSKGADRLVGDDDVPPVGVECRRDARCCDGHLVGRVSVALVSVAMSVLRRWRSVPVSDDQQGAARCHPIGDS